MTNIHCSSLVKAPLRLDSFITLIAKDIPLELSRSQIKHTIKEQFVNQKAVKISHKIHYKDEIYVSLESKHMANTHIYPEHAKVDNNESVHNSDLDTIDIIFEDSMLLVINKPRGMVVHPGAGHTTQTLAQIVFNKLKSVREEDLIHNRSGIVHRLDKDTSGVILLAKTARMHEKLSKLFSSRVIHKKYIAIVKGSPKSDFGSIKTFIGRNPYQRKKFAVIANETKGKFAHTDFRVLYSNDRYSILLCKIHTGRTHQIRVHLQSIGCPILGDRIYGRATEKYIDLLRHSQDIQREDIHTKDTIPLMLHAFELDFTMKLEQVDTHFVFRAPLPQDMELVCKILGYNFKKDNIV